MRDRSFLFSKRPGRVIFLLLIFITSFVQAQLTITVTSIPDNTPDGENIFLAGNFNNWNPGDPGFILTDHQNGTYSITFSPNPGLLEFKFTRGDWGTVEGNSQGGFVPNRSYNYVGGVQQTSMTIAGWEDNPGGVSTAADNVEILAEDFFIPQLNRTRRIWLYLPPDYHTSSKHYPVIYMHDGQNLFDVLTSFAGEWQIDESLNTLSDQGDFGAIVVGIENGGGERLNEYSPWFNPDFGAGGDGEAYADFLAFTLKPHIDSLYRTLPGREYTAIAGSSMGGNISMYTGIEHQDIFGKVGIFSPAFWFSDSSFIHLASRGIEQDLRVYFVAGENESATIIEDMMAMYDALIEAGQDESEMFFLSEPDGAHSEWFWAREFPDAYEWLFDGTILANEIVSQPSWSIYPNPVKEQLSIDGSPDGLSYIILSRTGERIDSGLVQQGNVKVNKLVQGYYLLKLIDHTGKTVFVKSFVKQD